MSGKDKRTHALMRGTPLLCTSSCHWLGSQGFRAVKRAAPPTARALVAAAGRSSSVPCVFLFDGGRPSGNLPEVGNASSAGALFDKGNAGYPGSPVFMRWPGRLLEHQWPNRSFPQATLAHPFCVHYCPSASSVSNFIVGNDNRCVGSTRIPVRRSKGVRPSKIRCTSKNCC